MNTFVFTQFAQKRFTQLSPQTKTRIISKLQELKTHPEVLAVLKPLHNFKPATHRLRIGDFRLILQLTTHNAQQQEFLVLKVGHRRDIYQ